MSEPTDGPTPYRVSYSEWVRNELRKLTARAPDRGLGNEVLAAVKEMDWRLHVYPQFGQPLQDLTLEPGQVWIGVVAPLVVRYALFEDRRVVMVAAPILPLPRSGLA